MKKVFFIFLLSCLILSGCSKHEEMTRDVSGPFAMDQAYESGDVMMFSAEDSLYSDGENMAVQKTANSLESSESVSIERMIIRNASLSITVLDTLATMDAVAELAEQMGGYVVSSSSNQRNYSGGISLPSASIILRIPAERLDETLNMIEAMTKDPDKDVSSRHVSGQDITSDYIDTKSRLTSLEATKDKLYEIMDTAQNAEEALAVYNSISEIEIEIEVQKGQVKYMEESVALSSIDLKIEPYDPDPVIIDDDWAPLRVIKDALSTLVDAAKVLVEVIIYIVIVAAPIALVIGLPIYFILRAKKKDKQNKTKEKTQKEIAES